MKLRSGMILAIGAGLLVLGGCAGATTAAGPTTSPTGRVYEPGTRPSQTRNSQTATLFVAQGNYEQALAAAQEGIAADSANPVHYYIAGQAYVGLGDFDAADRMFERAEEIYPAYEIEIEPEREQAWGIAFNEGVEAYNAGDMETAAAAWNRANTIYDVRAEAFLNLAIVETQQQDYEAAIEAYQGGLAALDRVPATREFEEAEIQERAESRAMMRTNLGELLMFRERFGEAEALFRAQLEETPNDPALLSQLALSLARQDRQAEAEEIYNRVLAMPGLDADDYFNVGVALFNSQAFERAAEAFARVTELQPNSRDAWYNYANSLYALDRFADLIPAGERLVELDPLSENSALILAQAYRQEGQNQKALEQLQRNAAAPVHLDQLQMQPREGRTRITGVVIGNEADAGTPVQIRFTFYGSAGEIGSETITVSAPATDETAQFEVVLESPEPAVSYSYQPVG
jgi:tetratricopeptide (TPR) repeat protein